MSLIDLYTSGSKDIAIFNLLFVFYGITTSALIFGLFKLTKQSVPLSRFILGMVVFYIGALISFNVSLELVIQFNEKIGQYVSGPAVALLLMLIGLALGGTLTLLITQKLVFKVKDINKSTIGFIVAQPILAIVFFVVLMFSGI